ncbi:transposable element Tcb1 transposase [Trichonephila clavipes]|nr:transposable element Tcb1 transposase [Trichonephila clavipes]
MDVSEKAGGVEDDKRYGSPQTSSTTENTEKFLRRYGVSTNRSPPVEQEQSADKVKSASKIGSRVGRNKTTVMRICDRWMLEGTMDQRGRSHPPQCTNSREDRQICQWSGLHAKRPLLGLPLTQNFRRLRRQWCDERRMSAAEWNGVVFTNQSRICLQHHYGRIRVWRHRGEMMLNRCVIHHHTCPALGIMV